MKSQSSNWYIELPSGIKIWLPPKRKTQMKAMLDQVVNIENKAQRILKAKEEAEL